MWDALSDELALASADILRSESRGIRDHIVLSQIRDFPFRRLLRLEVLLASRYISSGRTLRKTRPLPSNGYMQTTQKTLLPILLYLQRRCIETKVTRLLPACRLNVFTETLLSNGSTCHDMFS
jgi:hypothetical protein